MLILTESAFIIWDGFQQRSMQEMMFFFPFQLVFAGFCPSMTVPETCLGKYRHHSQGQAVKSQVCILSSMGSFQHVSYKTKLVGQMVHRIILPCRGYLL